MKFYKVASLSLCLVLLSGCFSGVSRVGYPSSAGMTTASGRGPVNISAANPLTSVTITLSDKVTDQLKDNPQFDQNELLKNVKHVLNTNKLLMTTPMKPGMTMEIVITDIRMRSTFSAVAFGFMAGSDSITGDVIIKNTKGVEIDKFQTSASYALGGMAGSNAIRVSWLYESFANEVAQELKHQK